MQTPMDTPPIVVQKNGKLPKESIVYVYVYI